MPESEGCPEVAHIRTHQWFGAELLFMRLRFMDGSTEVAVSEIGSVEELARVLSYVRGEVGDRLHAAGALQVHVWHNDAWWNLSDDLSQFFAWIIETGAGSLDETRAFAADPLSRPGWLFEAARQMQKLLEVASAIQPSEQRTYQV